MAVRPCLDGGTVTTGSRCPRCRRASPYQQRAWRELSRFVVARDGACQECGSTRYLAAHHVIPRHEGGADYSANPSRSAFAATAAKQPTNVDPSGIRPVAAAVRAGRSDSQVCWENADARPKERPVPGYQQDVQPTVSRTIARSNPPPPAKGLKLNLPPRLA
jgi:hypothetical protein